MQQGLNILEFRGVSKRYPDGVHALNDLSIAVPRGALFGLIGLNGAGKTTSLRILAGLLRKDEGSIRLFGEELDALDPSFKLRLGCVLDEPLYFDWMDLSGYLHFVGTMYGLPQEVCHERIRELITFFDLEGKSDTPIGTFSTGMKKKVSLAAAIIHKPDLIILDEPLEGIDAVASSAIKETLRLMVSGGATIIITSHVLDTIEQLCTDIAILHEGRLLFQCKREEIRSKARGTLQNATYGSLEELFVELVTDRVQARHLSWL